MSFSFEVCVCVPVHVSVFAPFSSLDPNNYIKVSICWWIVWGGLGQESKSVWGFNSGLLCRTSFKNLLFSAMELHVQITNQKNVQPPSLSGKCKLKTQCDTHPLEWLW